MICSFYVIWSKHHQFLPGLKLQVAIGYGTELGTTASLLLLSKKGVIEIWIWKESSKESVAKQSRVLAYLYCSTFSKYWYQQGHLGQQVG